jgi:hypothetical protein
MSATATMLCAWVVGSLIFAWLWSRRALPPSDYDDDDQAGGARP